METTTNPIQQQGVDTCAIKAQQLILEDFGINISEADLVEYSVDKGWYVKNSGKGTAMKDVGRILDAAKIPCTSRDDANVYDLANELQQGHKVIVGVDSGELRKEDSLLIGLQEWIEDFFGIDKPDHAIIVAGIDVSDPNNPLVLVTDPGTGDKEKAYPLKVFMDAWQDSKCFMCSTNVAPPGVVEQYHEYAVTTGDDTWDKMQMPEMPGVDKDAFQQCVDYSHAIHDNEDFREKMPSLYEWFDEHQLTWEKFRPYDLLPYFTQMNALASPVVFPPSPMPPVPPIMPCNFNYNSVMDTNWMNQPYAPMCFPPVQPMPMNPVFQPVMPSWDPMFNNPSVNIFPSSVSTNVQTTELEEEPTDPLPEVEGTHEDFEKELEEVEHVQNSTDVPSEAIGFPDIDIDEDEA